MPDTRIDFSAPAELRKWPSLNNQRVSASLGAANATQVQRNDISRRGKALAAFACVAKLDLSEGAHVNSTLKIQTSEPTLIEKIKAELKKRAEAKAKRMWLRKPKRLARR